MKKIFTISIEALRTFEELAKSYPVTSNLVVALIAAFASAVFTTALTDKANSINTPTPEVKVDSRNIAKQKANPVFKIDK